MKHLLSFASFATGFAVMGAEIAAGRLLAPAFGTSTLVWSSLIGVVLGGLAVGAALGGRWSRHPAALARAFGATAAAGVLLSALPTLAVPLMRATLESFLAGRLLLLGLGFAGVLALVVVPVVLLGAIGPVLVHHAPTERADVGRAAGRLSALGTIGSLAGTFACGIVLVPLLGTAATFRICGGLALAVGAVGAVGSWSTLRVAGEGAARTRHRALGRAAAAVVGVAALGSVVLASSATARRPGVVVFEGETAQNHLLVVDEGGERSLAMNGGYAKQTIARLDGEAYLRGVWGYYAVAPAFTIRPPSRILVLGLGGGTSARDYRSRFPSAEIVAVELDAGVVDVARRYFGLPSSVEVHEEDARTFLARDTRRFDLVVLDAFQFPYVPFQLTTREFFEGVRAHLREGGALMVNAGRKGNDLEVVHAVASTLETVFPYVSGANVKHTTNTILVATAHPLSAAGGARNVRFSERENAELGDLAPLEPWKVPDGERLVLTDDRAPVEWLTNVIVLRELRRMARGAPAS